MMSAEQTVADLNAKGIKTYEIERRGFKFVFKTPDEIFYESVSDVFMMSGQGKKAEGLSRELANLAIASVVFPSTQESAAAFDANRGLAAQFGMDLFVLCSGTTQEAQKKELGSPQ